MMYVFKGGKNQLDFIIYIYDYQAAGVSHLLSLIVIRKNKVSVVEHIFTMIHLSNKK